MAVWRPRRTAALGALGAVLAISAAAQDLTDLGAGSETQPAPAQGSIQVESTPGDDRAIAQRLRRIFRAVEGLDEVEVSVSSGVVELSGEVLSTEAAEKADRVARQVEGVVEVESRIQVARELDRRLRPALESLRERASALIGALPLFAVAVAVLAFFVGVAWLLTAWERPYQRLVRNGFARDLLRQVVRGAIGILGVVVALEILDATAMVAAAAGIAGLAGLALSFAFRDLVENYIASVLLSLRHPFLPNDHVVIEGSGEGLVVRLTSRATVLIDLDGNHVRIPNATVFKSTIRNFTRNPQRRFDVAVGVAPETDLAAALELGVRTLSELPATLGEPAPTGWIEQLSDWNVALRFYAWIDQRKADWFRTRSEGIRVVKEALDAAGISMPEPTLRVLRAGDAGERAREPLMTVAPPSLEMDVAPDRHLDRVVAEDRARSEPDLLDTAAPQE
jgi:small-conductance mechanosensitive channel